MKNQKNNCFDLDKFTYYGFWMGIALAFISMLLNSLVGIILEFSFLLFSFICFYIGTTAWIIQKFTDEK